MIFSTNYLFFEAFICSGLVAACPSDLLAHTNLFKLATQNIIGHGRLRSSYLGSLFFLFSISFFLFLAVSLLLGWVAEERSRHAGRKDDTWSHGGQVGGWVGGQGGVRGLFVDSRGEGGATEMGWNHTSH